MAHTVAAPLNILPEKYTSAVFQNVNKYTSRDTQDSFKALWQFQLCQYFIDNYTTLLYSILAIFYYYYYYHQYIPLPYTIVLFSTRYPLPLSPLVFTLP